MSAVPTALEERATSVTAWTGADTVGVGAPAAWVADSVIVLVVFATTPSASVTGSEAWAVAQIASAATRATATTARPASQTLRSARDREDLKGLSALCSIARVCKPICPSRVHGYPRRAKKFVNCGFFVAAELAEPALGPAGRAP